MADDLESPTAPTAGGGGCRRPGGAGARCLLVVHDGGSGDPGRDIAGAGERFCRRLGRGLVRGGVLALPFGVVLALLRLPHRAAIRWIATTYIEIFRSLPLLLLILVFVLALPPLGVPG